MSTRAKDLCQANLRQQVEKNAGKTLAEAAREAGFGPGERVKLREEPN